MCLRCRGWGCNVLSFGLAVDVCHPEGNCPLKPRSFDRRVGSFLRDDKHNVRYSTRLWRSIFHHRLPGLTQIAVGHTWKNVKKISTFFQVSMRYAEQLRRRAWATHDSRAAYAQPGLACSAALIWRKWITRSRWIVCSSRSVWLEGNHHNFLMPQMPVSGT